MLKAPSTAWIPWTLPTRLVFPPRARWVDTFADTRHDTLGPPLVDKVCRKGFSRPSSRSQRVRCSSEALETSAPRRCAAMWFWWYSTTRRASDPGLSLKHLTCLMLPALHSRLLGGLDSGLVGVSSLGKLIQQKPPFHGLPIRANDGLKPFKCPCNHFRPTKYGPDQ